MGYISPRIISFSQLQTSGTNPVDATTYYLAGAYNALSTVTTAGGFIMPTSGMIRIATILTYSATATGTNEAWVWSIRNNTTGVDYTVASVSAAAAVRNFVNANMLVPVSAGDEIFFKTTTPTWVTNPEGLRVNGMLFLEIA